MRTLTYVAVGLGAVVIAAQVAPSATASNRVTPSPTIDRHDRRRVRQYIQAWLASQGLRRLRGDRRLNAAAAHNSLALAEVDGQVPQGASSFLRHTLRQRGVTDARIHAVAVRYGTVRELHRDLDGFLRQHAPGGGLSHFGVAAARLPKGAGSRGVATVLLVRRLVVVAPVRARVGHPLKVCGRLLRGRDPQILVTLPRGRVLRRRPERTGRRFCAHVLTGGERGRHQIEIMVDGRYGPEVAALFPVYVGVAAPARPVRKLYPPEAKQSGAARGRLLDAINVSRRDGGLSPLTEDRQLSQVAQDHSADMRLSGFFGHVSPRRGGLSARLIRARIRHPHVSENLAVATGASKAHDALMASPAHRRNILDPRLTHIGIGVAADDDTGLLYITECFARVR